MAKLLLLMLLVVIVLTTLWFFGPRILRTVVLIGLISPFEREVPAGEQILILGDSTGYGTGALTNEESIAGRIGKAYPDFTIINDSKNGRTIGELVSVAKAVEGKYRLILLQIGGNDILGDREVATVEQELREIISVLAGNTEQLVMMSSGNVGGSAAFSGQSAKAAALEARSREFREMFMHVATETPLTYVDLFAEPDDDPFMKEPDVYLSFDGLHPSGEGYGLWFEKLHPVLEDRL